MIMGWLAAERGTGARDTEMNKINTGPWHFSLKGKQMIQHLKYI